MLSIRTCAGLALPLALVATVASVSPALAQGTKGGGGVRAAGSCSAGSHWKLKGKADGARVEVEFEVDSNVVGQSWSWQLTDNGTRVARGTARTVAPSGSFTVSRLITNRAGTDVVRFQANHAATHETCSGTVRV